MTIMKKNIILFILHMPPPIHGAAIIGQSLRNSKLINNEFDCEYINLTTASSLEDIGKFKIRKISQFFHLLLNIIKTVKNTQPNLVYITPNSKGGPFYKDFLIMMALKFMNCNIVAHYHNKGVSTRQNKIFDNFLYKHFFKDIEIILLSKRLYPDIERYVMSKDVYICPNGISEEMPTPQKGDREKTVRILFLSNLLIQKGVFFLLDALQALHAKGIDFSCHIVGAESSEITRVFLSKIIKEKKLYNCVFYHGSKYGIDKEQFWNNADIFVFPSLDECFPLVLLEAMKHGLPIVTTDEGGIPDIVKDGENGFICEKRSANDLAQKILLLLNDPSLRERMGKKGLERFKKNYTIDVFENQLVSIFKQILG